MRLTIKQRARIYLTCGYLTGILEAERASTGKGEEGHEEDAVYNAIQAALGSLEEAIEQDILLVNNLLN
ncbi:MAG: hypothetical protein LBP56_07510 [Odoribacteraceae bacterium]|jgi:hypothetical protein|nr:hypothetical protein [Odoribacteraceae bacterium]